MQPILSLIDTSVVGVNKLSTVEQLAALGLGVAWIDPTSYLFQIMGIATTSLYVNALNVSQLLVLKSLPLTCKY